MHKRELTQPLQRLIECCQRLNFGRITLRIQNGEPDPARPWRLRRTVKLAGGNNGPRPEAAREDFPLRQEHLALLAGLAGAPDGACVTLEVQHGLPFMLDIEQECPAA